MDIEIKTLPAYHVAYIRHISGYSKGQFNSEINQAFQQVCGWAAARDLFHPDTLVIGIPYDDPNITPNDRCRYDACVTVPGTVTEGAGAVGIQEISGGKYAACRISISAQETHKIGEAVDAMYGEWLPGSGWMVDDRPSLEIYYDNPDLPPGTWITMDYCIPVKPL
jgi:AraC family transcriptional regulator